MEQLEKIAPRNVLGKMGEDWEKKAITFGTIEDGQPELGDMPFCEEETKNSTVARFGHKMSKQDVHNIMQITRDEMEVCVSSFIL
eukprot:gene8692-34142_t